MNISTFTFLKRKCKKPTVAAVAAQCARLPTFHLSECTVVYSHHTFNKTEDRNLISTKIYTGYCIKKKNVYSKKKKK